MFDPEVKKRYATEGQKEDRREDPSDATATVTRPSKAREERQSQNEAFFASLPTSPHLPFLETPRLQPRTGPLFSEARSTLR